MRGIPNMKLANCTVNSIRTLLLLQIIATIAMIRELRTTRNVFLVNMAVSDLVIITVIVPFNVVGNYKT